MPQITVQPMSGQPKSVQPEEPATVLTSPLPVPPLPVPPARRPDRPRSDGTDPAGRLQLDHLRSGLGHLEGHPRAALQTPEGLTLGRTLAQVHAAYPAFDVSDAHEEDGGPEISAPQNPKAAYKVRFDAADKAVSFFLVLKNQNCFG